MGFIGKLIGGFFAFLGGILKTVTGIFGIGKSDYYMEAAPATETAAPAKIAPAKVEAAPAASKPAAETAPAQADLAPAPLETVKAAVAPAEAPTNGTAKTTAKKSPKAKAEKPAAPAKAAEPAPKGDQTFAPNYLMAAGSQNGRRRPGPSMDYFRNIAKQVKS